MIMTNNMNRWMLVIGLSFIICHLSFSPAKAQTSDSLIVHTLRDSGVRFTDNNSVTLLMSGQEKFDDMFHAILQAKSSIHLEYFNFRNDSIAFLLFDLLRLKHACILLKRTNINMSELAVNVGFMTAENFIKIFKEKFGLSPLEYRLKHRK